MNAIRLSRTPWAIVGAWWDRRCIAAKIRWAEGDIDHLIRQQSRDSEQLEYLRGHLQELRVQLALIKP